MATEAVGNWCFGYDVVARERDLRSERGAELARRVFPRSKHAARSSLAISRLAPGSLWNLIITSHALARVSGPASFQCSWRATSSNYNWHYVSARAALNFETPPPAHNARTTSFSPYALARMDVVSERERETWWWGDSSMSSEWDYGLYMAINTHARISSQATEKRETSLYMPTFEHQGHSLMAHCQCATKHTQHSHKFIHFIVLLDKTPQNY
jgi:hypothetical protein